MSALEQAARAVLARWDSPQWDWKAEGPTADLMHALRAALDAGQAQPVAPFGYVSEHNCEGPFRLQFHKEPSSVYMDNCKSITPVYTSPPARQAQPVARADGSYKVPYRCRDCGHAQIVTEVVVDSRTYAGSGANWCDACGSGLPERAHGITPDACAAPPAQPTPAAVRLLGDDLLTTITLDGLEIEVKWEEEQHEAVDYQFGSRPAHHSRWVTSVRLNGEWFDRHIFDAQFCEQLDAALAKALEPKA